LTLKLLTGNEALALGALHAGVKVVTGYPGTPSTGAIESLLLVDPSDACVAGAHVEWPHIEWPHIEWSTNEKVAFEIASGAAWAGQRALCTMKMSGVNVAYDSITSIAYSGVVGGLVIYVADDPGVSAGMCEQDSRGFAVMSDLPLLDATSVEDAYRLVKIAFDLSERTGTPVFVRLVTSISSSFAAVDVDDDPPAAEAREPQLIRDINRFTKAGSLICMTQHRDVIKRLGQAGEAVREMGLNTLRLSGAPGGVGLVTCGVVSAYLAEAFEIIAPYGFDLSAVSTLTLTAVHPFPAVEARALLAHCGTVLVLEELEPIVERGFYVEAQKMGWNGRILGKETGLFERVGEYGLQHIFAGLSSALPDLRLPQDLLRGNMEAEQLAAARPITVCAGCPHRGVFMGINQAVRKAGYKKDDVMVTGDIGCTILGMNPPFNTVWNEVSMGASIPLAQGYVYAGVKTPVIATIGDSTFFHAGIAGLVNAVQHQAPITVIILDNGWTSMTGMQANPGTDAARQPGAPDAKRTVDIAKIVEAIGVDFFAEIDPFDQEQTTNAILNAIKRPGVKVILARQECAMPARRRGKRAGEVRVIVENCNACKLCIIQTGCPAISLGDGTVIIDPELCYGCDLCGAVCNRDAIEFVPAIEVMA
jgi:indolepyruvate ferredoxin oxidoreductase, alpha subunit